VLGNQRPSLAEVTGGAGVTDRLIDLAGRLVPGRGPPMQHRDQGRLAGAKLQPQQVGEQLMVAIPLAAVVQRHHKQVRRLQLAQQRGRPSGLEHGVAQRTGQPLQHRGPQQEPPQLRWLALQHLDDQIVGHMAVTAGESGDEPAGILAAAQR
jgi:hypothetical protein